MEVEMTFVIHYTLADGTEDSIILTAETIEEIQQQAAVELVRRGGQDPWSEEIT